MKIIQIIKNIIKFNITSSYPSDAYVYIPFTEDEMDDEYHNLYSDFVAEALEFRSKNYEILYFGDEKLSTLKEGSKIYVLAHGNDINPNHKYNLKRHSAYYFSLKHLPFSDWAYAVHGSNSLKGISINMVAQRMKEDGLLEISNPTIKLYFCDPCLKAKAIAYRFAENFHGHDIHIDYYVGNYLITEQNSLKILSDLESQLPESDQKCEILIQLNDAMKICGGRNHKWSMNPKNDSFIKTSLTRHSIFTNSNTQDYLEEVPMLELSNSCNFDLV